MTDVGSRMTYRPQRIIWYGRPKHLFLMWLTFKLIGWMCLWAWYSLVLIWRVSWWLLQWWTYCLWAQLVTAWVLVKFVCTAPFGLQAAFTELRIDMHRVEVRWLAKTFLYALLAVMVVQNAPTLSQGLTARLGS